MTTALFLLRCTEIGIAIADLDLLTIGLVMDMWTEKGNRRGARRGRGEGEVYICAETKSRSAAYGQNAICAAGRSGGVIATTAWPVRTCAGSAWRISPPRSWRCTR